MPGGGGIWGFDPYRSSAHFADMEQPDFTRGKQLLQAAAGKAKETAREAMRAPSRLSNSLKRRASVAESGRTSRLERFKDVFRSNSDEDNGGCTVGGIGGYYDASAVPRRCASALHTGPRTVSTPEPFASAIRATRRRPLSLQVTSKVPPSGGPQTPTRTPSVSARRALNFGNFKNKITTPVVLSPTPEPQQTAGAELDEEASSRSSSPTPSVVTVIKWKPPRRRRRNKLTAFEMIKEAEPSLEDEDYFFRCDIYGSDGSDYVNAIEECMALVRAAGGQVLEEEWTYAGGFLYDMSFTPDENPLQDGDPTPAGGYIRVFPWEPYTKATYRQPDASEKQRFPRKRRNKGSAQTFIERQKEKARQRQADAEAAARMQSCAVSAITATTAVTAVSKRSRGPARVTMDTSHFGDSLVRPDSDSILYPVRSSSLMRPDGHSIIHSDSNGVVHPESDSIHLDRNGVAQPESHSIMGPVSDSIVQPDGDSGMQAGSDSTTLPDSSGIVHSDSNGIVHSNKNGILHSDTNRFLHSDGESTIHPDSDSDSDSGLISDSEFALPDEEPVIMTAQAMSITRVRPRIVHVTRRRPVVNGRQESQTDGS